MRSPRLALLLLALTAGAACGHGRVSAFGDVEYGKNAEEDFKEGEYQLATSHRDYAVKYFDHVRTRYPFSKFAPLADLRIADVKFEGGEYFEAIAGYQQFLKLHPSHEQADYAAFRIGLAGWEDRPTDVFIAPPAREKDLTSVRDCVKAFDDFLQKFPNSKYRQQAEQARAKAQALLLDHEWYVVSFYESRDRWPAVAARLQSILHDYPGTPREGEALFKLADAYLKQDDKFRAQQALQELIVKHPDDPRKAEAEKLLASLR